MILIIFTLLGSWELGTKSVLSRPDILSIASDVFNQGRQP